MQKILSSMLTACLCMTIATGARAIEVARYEFEGNADDSVTGDGAQNLQLLGEATITAPGIIGDGKLSLNGNTANYASVLSGTNGFTSGAPAVTLATWFTTTTIIPAGQPGATQQVLMQMPITGGTGLGQSAVAIEISSGRLQMGGRSSTADSYLFIDATLPEQNPFDLLSNTTYFGAAVIDYENDTVTGYLYDPALDEWKTASKEVAFTNTTGPGNLGLYVGRRGDPMRPFNGSIDNASIFTHALSEAELQAMAGYEPPPSGVDGDFDGDGDVDGRDFLIWQRGETDPALGPGDLVLWQDNYGVGTLNTIAAVVPEPSAAVLLGSVLVAGVSFRRRSL